jgi:hypothetical protein
MQMRIGEKECYCGGGVDGGHKLGIGGCYREWVSISSEPKLVLEDGNYGSLYLMPNGTIVTCTTLHDQRGYARHSSGRWSRTKDHESLNSLTG